MTLTEELGAPINTWDTFNLMLKKCYEFQIAFTLLPPYTCPKKPTARFEEKNNKWVAYLGGNVPLDIKDGSMMDCVML